MMSQLVSTPYPPVLELLPSTTISGLSPDTYTIFAVAQARIYHAQLATKTPEWCYSRMRGILVFGKDSEPPGLRPPASGEASRHWFRLLDQTSGKPIWMFRIPIDFAYELDRPFFHAFQGKSRRFGFLFEEDDEAGSFAKKVVAHTCPPRVAKSRSLSFSLRSKSPPGSGRVSINASMVSSPTVNSFVHVAHVGLNKEGVIEATSGIDPSWRAVLEGHNHRYYHEPIKAPRREHSFSDGLWQRQREASQSIDECMSEPVVHHVAPKDRRPRLTSPSFTMF